MNFFTYNGQSSADFGLNIESKNVFSAPAFDATFQAIPGRNGDLIIPNNRFANASVSYGNYNFYVIIGRPSSTASRTSLVVPRILLTTSAVSFQIADESNYKSFNLSYSGSTVTLAIQNGAGQINRVFGIN